MTTVRTAGHDQAVTALTVAIVTTVLTLGALTSPIAPWIAAAGAAAAATLALHARTQAHSNGQQTTATMTVALIISAMLLTAAGIIWLA